MNSIGGDTLISSGGDNDSRRCIANPIRKGLLDAMQSPVSCEQGSEPALPNEVISLPNQTFIRQSWRSQYRTSPTTVLCLFSANTPNEDRFFSGSVLNETQHLNTPVVAHDVGRVEPDGKRVVASISVMR